MAYNMTEVVGNVTGFLDLVQNTNHYLMNDYLGLILLIGLSVVIFGGFMWSTNNLPQSFAATMFLGFGLALLLDAMNLAPTIAVFIYLIGCALAMFVWRPGIS